jgi:hypothetical protein
VSTQKKIGRKLGKIWENFGKKFGFFWEKIRKFLGKNSEIFGKKFGNFWDDFGKILGRVQEYFRKQFGRRDCQKLGGMIFGGMNLGGIMMMIF